MSKGENFNIRISADMKKSFIEMLKRADKRQSDTVIELMKAAIRYFERNGNLYPPFELVPGERASTPIYIEELKLPAKVAESKEKYGKQKIH